MSQLDDIGDRDGWRCWVCDEPVDPATSMNDVRGPSVDSRTANAKARAAGDFAGGERLAHRGCNTRKGAVTPTIPWPANLVIVDPAPILAVAERLARKGGREVVVRCADRTEAQRAADWLVDRLSRLAPTLVVTASVDAGGGQFLVSLSTAAARRR